MATAVTPVMATPTTTMRASARAVGIAALLTGGFMLAEVAGGLVSGSLALLADAGHMLTDFAALSIAWLAFRVARRPADARRTYGFDRLSVLAAFVNGLALFAVAVWIVVEAAHRLAAPAPVDRRHHAGGGHARPPRQHRRLLDPLARRPRQPQPPRRPAARRSATSSARPAPSSRRSSSSGPAGRPIDPILSVLVSFLILRSAWTRGARQRPHPARGLAAGLRRRRHRRRPRRRRARRSPRSATCTPGRSPRTARW